LRPAFAFLAALAAYASRYPMAKHDRTAPQDEQD
jgi:hypothetical protein